MLRVHIYSKEDCHLCDVAAEVLGNVQQKHPFELVTTKIYDGHPKFNRFKERVPVIFIEGEQVFFGKVDEQQMLVKLTEAEKLHKETASI